MGYEDTPRYQKYIQKLQRMSPDQKAIFSSVIADEAFADKEMRDRLWSMAQKSGEGFRDRNFDLSVKTSNANRAIQESARDASMSERPFAEGLALANVGLSGYMGNAKLKKDMLLAKRMRDIGV